MRTRTARGDSHEQPILLGGARQSSRVSHEGASGRDIARGNRIANGGASLCLGSVTQAVAVWH
jgi:hypothetical protein